MNKITPTCLFVSIIVSFASSVSIAQPIGSVATVDDTMRANETRAEVGFALNQRDVIATNETGRGQLLFNDETRLSVAPNSEIILDEFVFDPSNGSGSLGLNLTKGALRFVGGQITKTQEAKIETPSGTIGIRGGFVLVSIEEDGVRAVFLGGQRMCITVAGNELCTSRPGGILNQFGYQGLVAKQELEGLLTRIDGSLRTVLDDINFDVEIDIDVNDFLPFDPNVSTSGSPLDDINIEENVEDFIDNIPTPKLPKLPTF